MNKICGKCGGVKCTKTIWYNKSDIKFEICFSCLRDLVQIYFNAENDYEKTQEYIFKILKQGEVS